jgi:histidinol phosphatase-like PHP family hydrolase
MDDGRGVVPYAPTGLMIQTEYYVNSVCRAAVALGYNVVLASDGHSVFDLPDLTAEQNIQHRNQTLGYGFVELRRADGIKF